MDDYTFSKDEIYQFRKKKVNLEIEVAKKLIESGINPLEVANKLIHEMFEIMRNGIKSISPELNQSQIEEKIVEHIKLSEVINRKGKKKVNYV